jgi:large subunit ribosomal protein L16
LTAHQINRLKLFLKRSVKKGDKTRRSFWFYAFPHLPLSRKPVGLRMGKGKGKLKCWFTNIRGGVVLFEFNNLRYGRSFFFTQQIEFKLGVKIQHLMKPVVRHNLPFTTTKKFLIKTFW